MDSPRLLSFQAWESAQPFSPNPKSFPPKPPPRFEPVIRGTVVVDLEDVPSTPLDAHLWDYAEEEEEGKEQLKKEKPTASELIFALLGKPELGKLNVGRALLSVKSLQNHRSRKHST